MWRKIRSAMKFFFDPFMSMSEVPVSKENEYIRCVEAQVLKYSEVDVLGINDEEVLREELQLF